MVAASALAEYQDPIDLAALKMPSTQQSLLLDAAQAGNRLVVVGERGHILYSDDVGQSWHQADVASRNQLNAVQFFGEQQGWAVGEDGVIVHTSDGGRHWQRQFDSRTASTQGPLLDVAFTSQLEGFAVGVFNKVVHTTDGGLSWHPWQEHVDNLDEWHLFALAATTPDKLYIASEMGLIFRSRDGGNSFDAVQSDHDGSFHGILARQGPDGEDQLILFGVGGVVFTSHDGGDSWSRLKTDTEDGLSSGTWLADGSALLVGANGVVVTIDNSLRLTTVSHTESGLPLSSVVAPSSLQRIVVGLGGIVPLAK
ncbi:MAG: YCF48-related protein [Bermanella sp.]